MKDEQLKSLIEKCRRDKKFFHALVFDHEASLKSFLGADAIEDSSNVALDPQDIFRILTASSAGCSEGGSTCSCTSGTCGGETCGGHTCSVTCSGDSCGNTCGDSCGYTTNLGLGGFSGYPWGRMRFR